MSRERYLAAATAWDQAGKPVDLLLHNKYQLFAMRCWIDSGGAQQEGIDQVVADFHDANEKHYEAKFPNWWQQLMASRENCDFCSEQYKVKNLSICTGCLGTYCYRCIDYTPAANGNRRHACGGEIVG
jgi:hypothetical protein